MSYLTILFIVPLRQVAFISIRLLFTLFSIILSIILFKIVSQAPSLIIKVLSFYMRFLLYNLYYIIALLAIQSLVI